MSKLIPLEDNVIVEPFKEETKTASGIVLPDSGKDKPGKGKVVAVGPGKLNDDGKRNSMDVKIGEIVYFTKYSPDELEVDGDKVLVIKASSILAKEGK